MCFRREIFKNLPKIEVVGISPPPPPPPKKVSAKSQIFKPNNLFTKKD